MTPRKIRRADQAPPELEGNRFEAMYQRLRSWRINGRRIRRHFSRFILLLLIAEIVSLASIFVWYRARPGIADPLLDQFILTRNLVSPFIFENPVKKFTKAKYLGPYAITCNAARWTHADPLLGWRLSPNVGILKQPMHVDDQIGWRFTNAQGFASAGEFDFDYARPKPEGTYRVIVTGASSVEGDGAEDPQQTLPAMVRARLIELGPAVLPDGFKRLEVINGGVGGYQSSQEYLYQISVLRTYEPDLIISYSGAVDLIRARITYDENGRAMDLFRTARHEAYDRYLEGSFSLLSPIAMFFENALREAGCLVDGLGTVYVVDKSYDKVAEYIRSRLGVERKALAGTGTFSDINVPVDAALASYENGMNLMMKAAEVYHYRIAFFLQPMMTTDVKPLTTVEAKLRAGLSDREIEMRAAYYAKARKLLNDRGGRTGARSCFADMSQPFGHTSERVWDDTRHLLGAGNRIVAERVVAQLQNCGMIGRTAK